jgi:hypothetical protein
VIQEGYRALSVRGGDAWLPLNSPVVLLAVPVAELVDGRRYRAAT